MNKPLNIVESLNIHIVNPEDRNLIINNLADRLDNKQVKIISVKTIKKQILEEQIHDFNFYLSKYGQSLESMSSGERMKALFESSVEKCPDILILDHFMEHLDQSSILSYTNKIETLSNKILIINIYTRQRDNLAFIHSTERYSNNTINSVLENKIEKEHAQLPPSSNKGQTYDGELVSFTNVNLAYKQKPILQNINWTINTGEFWHLYGPNGTGKTSLLTMITGDNHKAYGQDIRLFGMQKGSGESIWHIKRKIGYFTSNMTFGFWRTQTVLEMVISGFYDSIGLYTKPGDHRKKLAKDWLRYVELEHLEKTQFIKLSLRHQRMVLITRAMVKHPPLLILDEPSVDLDENSALKMTHLINKIASESHTTIIYVSHRLEEGIKPSHGLELSPSPQGSTAHTYDYREKDSNHIK
ncbi:ABC transporter ATP-binding protein [Reichenbachiella versicolor]|uniref:ABC transporter ATP-binding protein n=1 Tax=Reichenbachiella versicolor TaxID=1821036 RepID=UPI000D6E111F|nr:ATP-binding cassette domain-containing protein [Reichenbachiella versicolor]